MFTDVQRILKRMPSGPTNERGLPITGPTTFTPITIPEDEPVSGGTSGSVFIYVRNDSGSDCVKYDVLGLDDILVDPEATPAALDDLPSFIGLTPNRDDHWGAFAVLQQDLDDGDTGLAIIHGATWVRLYVREDWHKWCDLRDSDLTQLETRGHGSTRIMWKQSGVSTDSDDPKLAAVVLGAGDLYQIVLGKFSENVLKDHSGTLTIWDGTTKGSEVETTRTVEAWNRFANVAYGGFVAAASIGRGDYQNEYDAIAGACAAGTVEGSACDAITTTCFAVTVEGINDGSMDCSAINTTSHMERTGTTCNWIGEAATLGYSTGDAVWYLAFGGSVYSCADFSDAGGTFTFVGSLGECLTFPETIEVTAC